MKTARCADLIKRGYFFASLLIGFVIFTSPLLAAVEATGEGTTYRQALNNALKQAVEKTLGTQIETQSVVENFVVVREKILNHTKGYVKSFDVIEDKRDENGIYRLVISAEVDKAQIADSQTALSTLMKMAAHPKVFIIGIDDDFDAISSLNPEFDYLSQAVIQVVRDEFKMNVIDHEALRLSQKDSYRYTDRQNNMKRAKIANAQFALFVSVLKNKSSRHRPLSLRLETVDVANGLSLGFEEIDFNMDDWTHDLKGDRELIITQAQSLIHAPAAQAASVMIETLQKENYGEGKRYELKFSRFNEKTIKFLEEDLTRLSGYVRHKLMHQEKNALALSYWSELRPGALNVEISSILQGQEITFTHSVKNRNLNYRFKDPFFE